MRSEDEQIEDYLLFERDLTGKSYPIYFRIPPVLWRGVNDLIAKRIFPFATRQDLFRWAFHRGITSLATMKLVTSVPLMEFPLRIFNRPWPGEHSAIFTSLLKTVFQMQALGYGPLRLRKFANAIEELIQCLPDTHHRDDYLASVRRVWECASISTAEPTEEHDGR